MPKFALCLFVLLALVISASSEVGPAFSLEETQQQLQSGSCQLEGKVAHEQDGQIALYPCTNYLTHFLEQRGLPMSDAVEFQVRTHRRLVDLKQGRFAVSDLKPGRYYLESPPLYNLGDNPSIDRIFSEGGCVYFASRRAKIIEVSANSLTEVEL